MAGAGLYVVHDRDWEVSGVAVTREDGWSAELVIRPGLALSPSAVFGFEVAVDDDDDGETRERQLTWADPTGSASVDATVFGRVLLVDGEPPPTCEERGLESCDGQCVEPGECIEADDCEERGLESCDGQCVEPGEYVEADDCAWRDMEFCDGRCTPLGECSIAPDLVPPVETTYGSMRVDDGEEGAMTPRGDGSTSQIARTARSTPAGASTATAENGARHRADNGSGSSKSS